MSLQGPMIVVADPLVRDIVDALTAAGAFPVVEATWAQAAAAFANVQPGVVVLAAPAQTVDPAVLDAFAHTVAAVNGPWVPIVARGAVPSAFTGALAVSDDAPMSRLIARVASALRARALDATVLRRLRAMTEDGATLPPLPAGDPLHEATVLLLGRGASYPSLSVAIGERVAVIGALSVQTAARTLGDRDINGIVIGDGFGPRMIEAFMTVMREDSRFRDLPLAVLGDSREADPDGLPNFERHPDPAQLIRHVLPLVRLHAMEARLKRLMHSLDNGGNVDPATGLLTQDAFVHDLDRAVADALDRGVGLSVARFAFDASMDDRQRNDLARLFSRMVRVADFACQESDGSIVLVFTETELRDANVVARRIASVLKHTLGAQDRASAGVDASIVLATLKPTDTIATLMERVLGPAVVAAE